MRTLDSSAPSATALAAANWCGEAMEPETATRAAADDECFAQGVGVLLGEPGSVGDHTVCGDGDVEYWPAEIVEVDALGARFGEECVHQREHFVVGGG